MYYLLITLSAVMLAAQFLITEHFQREEGAGLVSSLKYSVYSSVVGFLALLIINKFAFSVSLFSTVVAIVYGGVCVGLNYSSIKAFKYANLSVYSVFSMIGGMVLPFIYGMLAGEEFKAVRIVCLLLISVSVALSATNGKNSKKAIKYYIGVFVLNGLVGVISAFHQAGEGAVDSASFSMLTKITTGLFALAMLLFTKDKSLALSKKAFALCTGSAVINTLANLFILIALLNLPASVQYPILTGGVIVFSAIIDALRKKPVGKKTIISVLAAFVGSVFMAL
ncbi:MAG: hypothetical protein Q4B31_02215 [Clostridia bacterium]|nr:hypothetical protein [Clostridia bacterium]